MLQAQNGVEVHDGARLMMMDEAMQRRKTRRDVLDSQLQCQVQHHDSANDVTNYKKLAVEFTRVFQPCTSRLHLVWLFLCRKMSTQHWSRVVTLQVNTSSVECIAGGNLETITY